MTAAVAVLERDSVGVDAVQTDLAVTGGLRLPDSDALIARASISVGARYAV